MQKLNDSMDAASKKGEIERMQRETREFLEELGFRVNHQLLNQILGGGNK